jgi:hypothetical protein
VSQPTRTAQLKKLEDALRLRLLGGRKRIVRNLLPMPEPVLTRFEYGAARRAGGGRWNAAAWMRIAALLRRSFNRGPSRLPRKGRSSPIIARDRDASKRVCLDSNRSACQRYFTGMIIGYPFGVTTVINHLCMSVLLVLDAQCTYAALSGGEYAVTVKPGFMGIDCLPISCMTPVPSSTYASSGPGW